MTDFDDGFVGETVTCRRCGLPDHGSLACESAEQLMAQEVGQWEVAVELAEDDLYGSHECEIGDCDQPAITQDYGVWVCEGHAGGNLAIDYTEAEGRFYGTARFG